MKKLISLIAIAACMLCVVPSFAQKAIVRPPGMGKNNVYNIKGELTVDSAATFSNAGGVTAQKLLVKTAQIIVGTGSPASVVAAPVGSVFLRTDGGTSTTIYIKETGTTTSTGWVAK